MSDQRKDAVAFWILSVMMSQRPVGLVIFRFRAAFMLGKLIRIVRPSSATPLAHAYRALRWRDDDIPEALCR